MRCAHEWDHPRVCGEQLHLIVGAMPGAGSSPRVRGAGGRTHGVMGWQGIIPACAGSSQAWRGGHGRSRDHPRVCGEQLLSGITRAWGGGSSPRVRGAGLPFDALAPQVGIIPACAGSSPRRDVPPISIKDHPRVCGEQLTTASRETVNLGSSPRVRGAAKAAGTIRVGRGIIPACAGSRPDSATWTVANWDHPRVCGEQWPGIDCMPLIRGSSPRVRGADNDHALPQSAYGIIPACAGSRLETRS